MNTGKMFTLATAPGLAVTSFLLAFLLLNQLAAGATLGEQGSFITARFEGANPVVSAGGIAAGRVEHTQKVFWILLTAE